MVNAARGFGYVVWGCWLIEYALACGAFVDAIGALAMVPPPQLPAAQLLQIAFEV